MRSTLSLGLAVLLPGTALGAARDVQIRSINFTTGIVEVHNCGAASESLTGWRFCTHDSDEIRRYSGATGLDAFTLAPGGSLFIHFNNDAPADPAHVNISTIGGVYALPLDNDAYGMGLFWQIPFSVGTNIADHVQWNISGADNTIADERSDEAQAGGVWTDENNWVSTTASTGALRLLDTACGVLHGPKNYQALDLMPDCNANGIDDFFDIADGTSTDDDMNGTPDECETPPVCPGDADGSTVVDFDDLNLVLANWNSAVTPGTDGDVTEDGMVNFDDLNLVLANWGNTCAKTR